MDNNLPIKTYRAVILEWTTLAGIIIACFLFLHFENKNICNTIEQRMSLFEQRMINSEHRSDRLYEMFIDLVKEKK